MSNIKTNTSLKINSSYTDYVTDDSLSMFLDNMKFEIKSCGRWLSNSSSTLNNFIIHDYELVYLIEGSTFLTKNGITYELVPGSILLLEPNTIFSASTCTDDTTSYYYIHFEMYPMYKIYELFKLIGFSNVPIVLNDTTLKLLSVFRQAVEESLNQNQGYKTIIASIFNYILIYIIRNKQLDNNIVSNIVKVNINETCILDDATEYISDNINTNLKISEIANFVNVSENYLYKTFKKFLGISPSKYIKDIKINKSMQLLETGTYSIKEISTELGFSSPYHFSNTFKSYTGISPSQYIEHYSKVVSNNLSI